MDVITMTVTHAIFYAGLTTNYTDTPQVNFTELSPTRWWGPAGGEANQDTGIYETSITFNDEMVEDLKERLSKHQEFVPGLEGIGFQYGFNPNIADKWIDKWLNEYDFKEREAFFNQFPMYKTNIQGLDIFYVRVTPEVPEGKILVPFMLVHGFPSSFREFYDMVKYLTIPDENRPFVLELIIPSLPGFGFSQGAVRPGLGAAHMAVVLRNLMHRIGYQKFYVHGGDFAALILGHMATIYPEEVLGYHTNWGVLLSPVAIFLQMVGQLYPSLVLPDLSLYNRMYPIQNRFNILLGGTGYLHLQATKPDTLGVALTDSPSGLLAWILEKYATANTKSNINREDGGLENDYDQNFLLDTLTLWWSSKSIQTAMRLYSETFNRHHFELGMERIPTNVPMWVVQAVDEFTYQSPLILSLKYKNIIKVDTWNEGGHFLSIGFTERFAQNILDAVAGFMEWHAQNGTDTTYVKA